MYLQWLTDARHGQRFASKITVGDVLLLLTLYEIRKQTGRNRIPRDHSPTPIH